MTHRYTPEQFAFVKENVSGRSLKEITGIFNTHFGLELSIGQIRSFLTNRGLKTNSKFTYSDEQIKFIADNIKGRSHREMAIMFNEHFGTDFPASAISSLTFRHGLKNERDCRILAGVLAEGIGKAYRFKPGMTPWNKGKKGTGGWEPTQFKKGQIPRNYRPVGSERVNVYGYIEVKVADPRTWKLKQVVVWEAANGPIPAGHCLLFADGDKLNVMLDNLLLVSRRELAVMNKKGLISNNAELTRAGVMVADIYLKIGERKRK